MQYLEKSFSVDMTKKICDDCGKEFNTRRRFLNHIKQYGYTTTLNGKQVRVRGTKG